MAARLRIRRTRSRCERLNPLLRVLGVSAVSLNFSLTAAARSTRRFTGRIPRKENSRFEPLDPDGSEPLQHRGSENPEVQLDLCVLRTSVLDSVLEDRVPGRGDSWGRKR
jgi:hypothetical protein